MADHRDTVRAIYQAFQRGDVPYILDRLAPDVVWEDWATAPNHAQTAGVPWMKVLRGRESVLDFFQLLGSYKFTKFDVQGILTGDDMVAGVVAVEFVLPDGRVVSDEEIHLFRFDDDGRVTSFRHYLDTAKAIAAVTAG